VIKQNKAAICPQEMDLVISKGGRRRRNGQIHRSVAFRTAN